MNGLGLDGLAFFAGSLNVDAEMALNGKVCGRR